MDTLTTPRSSRRLPDMADAITWEADDTGASKAKIKLSVESMAIPPARLISTSKEAYFLKKSFKLYQLVEENYANCLINIQRALDELYMCGSIKADMEEDCLSINIIYAHKKTVSLQCDQSSGHLAKEFAKCILNRAFLRELDAQEIALTTEVSYSAV